MFLKKCYLISYFIKYKHWNLWLNNSDIAEIKKKKERERPYSFKINAKNEWEKYSGVVLYLLSAIASENLTLRKWSLRDPKI